ncbi:MAG: GNAT family N-acetyltransferase [Marmoricola sp.]
MADAEIEVRKNEAAHRYEAFIDRDRVGFAEYQLTDQLVVFTHTEVEDRCEGLGVGSALAKAALDDVRAEGGRKVLPLCPFIKGWIAHHADYQDLVYGAPLSTARD